MATSAFKSTTKRTPVGSSPSSAGDSSSYRRPEAHRRSRSLSRFSRRLPGDYTEEDAETPAPPTRGRFVNTLRGTGFPETTLDDLAVTFFGSAGGDRGRSGSRGGGGDGDGSRASASQRRGRSVSRQGANCKGAGGNSYKNARADSEISNSRRRRSVSVVRYRMSDSESDLDHPHTSSNHAKLRDLTEGNKQVLASDKTAYSNPRPGLKRSLSQKDLRQHDGYSSHSSVLTDDEGRDAYCDKNGPGRTIRAVYAQKKIEHPTRNDVNGGLYEVMRKELRHAVDEIRMELEQSTIGKRSISGLASDDFLESRGSDVMRVVKSYASKLEQSEKRKHDLLAEMVLEEQRGQEISRIVKELLPDTQNAVKEKPLRTRKSNDRSRMSKRLTEEAEKYIEDFLSNIEDTDISSLDGERSETSSTLGGTIKNETFQSPPLPKSFPVEMDGVVLPWLQWETANDTSPLPHSINMEPALVPKATAWHTLQEASPLEPSNHTASSRGSWSPVVADGQSATAGEVTGSHYGETGSSHCQLGSLGTKSSFDVQECLSRASEEEFLLERWRQHARICSGSLLLYNHMSFIR